MSCIADFTNDLLCSEDDGVPLSLASISGLVYVVSGLNRRRLLMSHCSPIHNENRGRPRGPGVDAASQSRFFEPNDTPTEPLTRVAH